MIRASHFPNRVVLLFPASCLQTNVNLTLPQPAQIHQIRPFQSASPLKRTPTVPHTIVPESRPIPSRSFKPTNTHPFQHSERSNLKNSDRYHSVAVTTMTNCNLDVFPRFVSSGLDISSGLFWVSFDLFLNALNPTPSSHSYLHREP